MTAALHDLRVPLVLPPRQDSEDDLGSELTRALQVSLLSRPAAVLTKLFKGAERTLFTSLIYNDTFVTAAFLRKSKRRTLVDNLHRFGTPFPGLVTTNKTVHVIFEIGGKTIFSETSLINEEGGIVRMMEGSRAVFHNVSYTALVSGRLYSDKIPLAVFLRLGNGIDRLNVADTLDDSFTSFLQGELERVSN